LTRTNVQRPEVGLYHVVISNFAGIATSRRVHLQVELTTEGIPLAREEATDDLFDLTNALRVFSIDPPPTVMFRGAPLLFTTYKATTAPWETNHCGVIASHSMWILYHSFRAQSTRVSTEGSSFDTVVAVYHWNTNSEPVLVDCNNDGGYDGHTSLFYFDALAGKDYYIAVDGVAGATGIVRLEIGEFIRKARFNAANGSFRFEFAGPFWYTNILQSTNQYTQTRQLWPILLTVPATTQDWVLWYTNPTALSDARRFYTLGVRTNAPTFNALPAGAARLQPRHWSP
jgi:hypothetical protein